MFASTTPIQKPKQKIFAGFALIALLSFVTLMSAGETMAASQIERSKDFFLKLNKDTLNLVDGFYDPQVVFQDPVHVLVSASEVKKYYEGLYKNVSSIRWEFFEGIESGKTVSLTWKMYLKTPSLNGGKEITVDGVSIISFNEKGLAIRHRDYFDMGEFVYEKIPGLNWIIRYIKSRMAGE